MLMLPQLFLQLTHDVFCFQIVSVCQEHFEALELATDNVSLNCMRSQRFTHHQTGPVHATASDAASATKPVAVREAEHRTAGTITVEESAVIIDFMSRDRKFSSYV